MSGQVAQGSEFWKSPTMEIVQLLHAAPFPASYNITENSGGKSITLANMKQKKWIEGRGCQCKPTREAENENKADSAKNKNKNRKSSVYALFCCCY